MRVSCFLWMFTDSHLSFPTGLIFIRPNVQNLSGQLSYRVLSSINFALSVPSLMPRRICLIFIKCSRNLYFCKIIKSLSCCLQFSACRYWRSCFADQDGSTGWCGDGDLGCTVTNEQWDRTASCSVWRIIRPGPSTHISFISLQRTRGQLLPDRHRFRLSLQQVWSVNIPRVLYTEMRNPLCTS